MRTAATLLVLPTVFGIVQKRASLASPSLDPDDPDSPIRRVQWRFRNEIAFVDTAFLQVWMLAGCSNSVQSRTTVEAVR